jgi:hypothetical protein
MKKKMHKFEGGGLSKAQEEWLGGADRSDPIIMARMRRAVPDEPKAAPKAAPKADTSELRDETGATSKIRRNTETGDLYNTEAPTPKAETKPAPKAETKPAPKAEAKPAPKAESKSKSEMGPTKKTTVQDFRESLKKGPEMPGSYKKESAGSEKPKAKIEPGTFSFGKIAKDLREKAGITSYKSGGAVKSSASRRADGCAIRGKTKGRMV